MNARSPGVIVLAALLAVACTPARPMTAPPAGPRTSVVALASPASTATFAGVVRAPAGIMALAGAGVISDQGSGVVSNNGAQVVGKTKLYRALAVAEAPLAHAEVYLADPAGRALPDVPHTLTDDAGHYTLAGAPAGHLALVVVRVRTADGREGSLQTLAADPGTGADVDLASTLVTRKLIALQPSLQSVDPTRFQAAVKSAAGALAAPDETAPPDLADRDAVLARADALAARHADLDAALGELATAPPAPMPASASPLPASPLPASPGVSAAPTSLPSPTPSPAASTAPTAPPSVAPTPAPPLAFAFSAASDLATARYGHTSHVLGRYLYVLGGGDADPTGIERATLDGGGVPGAFSGAGLPTLTTPRVAHDSVVIGNYLYVLGGSPNWNDSVASIERAPVDADGNLGAFAAVPQTLAIARHLFRAIVLGNWLYVIGGNNKGAQATVERAPIAADGSLGAFSTTSSTLVDPRYAFSIARTSKYLYVLGGYDNTPPYYVATVERAPIDAAGNLGAFEALPASGAGAVALTAPASDQQAAVLGDHVYVFGGYNAQQQFLRTVQAAPILPDGSLGNFVALGAARWLVTPRDRFALATTATAVYVTGGAAPANPGVQFLTGTERSAIALP